MDQMPMVSRDGDKTVLCLTGDITATNAPELRLLLKNLIADGARELVIDLINVRVVDSSGIGLLVAGHNSLSRLGGKLAVIHASNDLVELFKAFRLDKHFSISKTE
jgi:anti-anti-sigma factor